MSALRTHFRLPQHDTPAAVRLARGGSAALVAALLAVSLTACTGLGAKTPEAPGDQPAGEQSEQAEDAKTGTISPKLQQVPKLSGSVGVVKDAKLTACSTKQGKVAADGTVTNSADQTRDIVVVVSWVTPTSDVVARGVTEVKNLKAGKSADWKANSTLKYDGSAQCVMTVNAGKLAS